MRLEGFLSLIACLLLLVALCGGLRLAQQHLLRAVPPSAADAASSPSP